MTSGSSSVVERDLAKVDVAGSTPVSRSRFSVLTPVAPRRLVFSAWKFWLQWPEARYPSGKGEVCKTFMRRFDSAPRLQILRDSHTRSDFSRRPFPLYRLRNS